VYCSIQFDSIQFIVIRRIFVIQLMVSCIHKIVHIIFIFYKCKRLLKKKNVMQNAKIVYRKETII